MTLNDLLWSSRAAITVFLIPFSVVSIILFFVLSWILKKFRSLPIWAKLSIIFGISHLVILSYWSINIFQGMKYDYEYCMMWFVFTPADFPVSLIEFPLSYMLGDQLHTDIINFVLPSFIFTILGSLQYSLWGYLIGKVIYKIKIAKNAK